jgi:NADPH2:quinone reductase
LWNLLRLAEMIDLGGGSQPPQRHPKEPHPMPALPFNIALLKGASLVGVDSAQIRRQEPEVYARLTNDIASWLGKEVLEPPATQTFPFDRFMEAFDAISSRRATGKIVVEMDS